MNQGEYPPVGSSQYDGQIVIHLPIDSNTPTIDSAQSNFKKNEDILPTYEQAIRMKLFQSSNL